MAFYFSNLILQTALINLWTRQSNQQLLDKYDLAMEAWNKREKLSISINLIVIKKET